jgi:hypothetical protein
LLIKNKVLNHHVSLGICFFDDKCNSYHWVKSIHQLKNIFELPENQPNGGTDFATLIEEVWKNHNHPPKRPHHHKHNHSSPVDSKEHEKHSHSPTKSETLKSDIPPSTEKHHHKHHHTKKDVDTRLFIFTDGAPSDTSIEKRTEELITEIANTIDDEKRFFITFYQIGDCDIACKFLHLLDHLDEKGAKRDIVDRVSAFSRGEADGHIFSHLLRCCAAFKDMEFDIKDFDKFKN